MKVDEQSQFGDVYQIKPDHKLYPGYLVVVTESKSWGIQGYLMHWCDFDAVRYKDMAYVRVSWDEIEYVGKLPYVFYCEEG